MEEVWGPSFPAICFLKCKRSLEFLHIIVFRFSSSVSLYSKSESSSFHTFFFSYNNPTSQFLYFPPMTISPLLSVLWSNGARFFQYTIILSAPVTLCIHYGPFYKRWGNKTLTRFPLLQKNMSCVTQPQRSLLPARSHHHHRNWTLSIHHHIKWTKTIPLQLQNQNTPPVFLLLFKNSKMKKRETMTV